MDKTQQAIENTSQVIKKAGLTLVEMGNGFARVAEAIKPLAEEIYRMMMAKKRQETERKICLALFLNVYVLGMYWMVDEYKTRANVYHFQYGRLWSPVWHFISLPVYTVRFYIITRWGGPQALIWRIKRLFIAEGSAPDAPSYKKATECHDKTTQCDKSSCRCVGVASRENRPTPIVEEDRITYLHDSGPVKGPPVRLSEGEYVIPRSMTEDPHQRSKSFLRNFLKAFPITLVIGLTSCNSWIVDMNNGWNLEHAYMVNGTELRIYEKHGVRDTVTGPPWLMVFPTVE